MAWMGVLIWAVLACTVWTLLDRTGLLDIGLAANQRQPNSKATSTKPNRLQQFNTDGLLIPVSRLLSGGPGKDGIPSLTNPRTVSVSQADFLKDHSRVIGVNLGGESRVYPIAVLNWHEIINDRLGTGVGVDIAVIYCPLCDSASVVERTLNGHTYEFGISGLLYNSNVLFFDRTDEALWTQVGHQALSGPNRGMSLKHLAGWEITTFGDWKARYPDSTVVTFDTGHKRAYGRNPYARYFKHDRVSFPLDHMDTRHKNKELVIGLQLGELSRAYPVLHD